MYGQHLSARERSRLCKPREAEKKKEHEGEPLSSETLEDGGRGLGPGATDATEGMDLLREAVGRIGPDRADPEPGRLKMGGVHDLAGAVSAAARIGVRAAGPVAADAQVDDERVLAKVAVRVAGGGRPGAGRVAPGRRVGPQVADVGRDVADRPLEKDRAVRLPPVVESQQPAGRTLQILTPLPSQSIAKTPPPASLNARPQALGLARSSIWQPEPPLDGPQLVERAAPVNEPGLVR